MAGRVNARRDKAAASFGPHSRTVAGQAFFLPLAKRTE